MLCEMRSDLVAEVLMQWLKLRDDLQMPSSLTILTIKVFYLLFCSLELKLDGHFPHMVLTQPFTLCPFGFHKLTPCLPLFGWVTIKVSDRCNGTAGHSSNMPGLQALVQGCRARQPELVQQVESMMTELEHMSVLWAEQWHIALLELQVTALPRRPLPVSLCLMVVFQSVMPMPVQLNKTMHSVPATPVLSNAPLTL